MSQVLDLVKWLYENYAAILGGADAVVLALIALFMLIPGAEPEASMKKIADFLEKFSRK